MARIFSQDAEGVTFTLEATDPVWREADGYAYPSLPGFGLLDQPGNPALPVRVERVGIPAGTEPTLTVLDARSVELPTGLVGPVQRWVPVHPDSSETVPVGFEDPTVYSRDALFPASEPVRLGKTGALREQPFVEIVFTPVLHNPVRRTTTSYTRVTVRVDFGTVAGAARTAQVAAGAAAGAVGAGGDAVDAAAGAVGAAAGAVDAAAGEDPEFESVYDGALVNSGQARSFRVPGPRPEAEGTNASLAPVADSTFVTTRYKMVVYKDGIYRLSAAWAGTNAPALVNANVANIRIDCQDRQIPITVVDADSNGIFDGTDVIEFYGQALTWDILAPDAWESGDYTDDNIYWLFADSAAGSRAAVRASAPTDVYPIPSDFSETVRHEINSRFVGQVSQDTVDHWYEDPPVYNPGFPSGINFSVATPGVSTATTTASIKVRLLGENYYNNLHRSTIKVNGTVVSGPSNWDGFREFTHGVDNGPANFPQSILNDANPETTGVNVSLALRPGVSMDFVDQNWIEVTYGRQFKVGTDDILMMSVPNQNQQLRITGLSASESAIYEITRTLVGNPLVDPVRITGGRSSGSGPFGVEFEVTTDATLPPGATRRFLVCAITASGATGDLLPASARPRPDSYLRSPATGADWLAVYNASLVDVNAASWTNLLARRQSRGLRVKTVAVEDVYDEFSYGIEDPQGIRDFFAWVYAHWPRVDPAVPLTYGILIGDAAFDYKNYYGYPTNQNLLSTYMRSVPTSPEVGYMSDETYFAAVSGADEVPDFFLGRWPVHSIAETNGVAQKILDYETAPTGAPRPAWQYDAVFAADDNPTSEMVQDRQIVDYFVGTAHTYHRTYLAHVGCGHPQPPACTPSQTAAEMRARLIGQFNGIVDPGRDIGPGAALMSYVGRGGFQNWATDQAYFTVASSGPDDLSSLNDGAKLTFLLIPDTYSGVFAATTPIGSNDLSYTFGEDFLVTPSKGAIGVIAPSHLGFLNARDTVEGAFFEQAYGPTKTRGFGNLTFAIQLALAGLGDSLHLRSYALLADPAVKLIVPAPAKPTNVTAVLGNHKVTVSWTASPDAAYYRVYESFLSPGGPYFQVAAVSGSPYVATGLTNCSTYCFAVTSVDSEGFESAWSQLNTGCGSGGPCVCVTPRNDSAPAAPGGVSATNYESGGAVLVSWSPNAPADEASSYTVYWGITPGVYTDSRTAGSANSLLATGLTDGITYYFAVSASNCSRGEGPKSPPVPSVPRRIEGIKPPNEIDDLRVHRSPDPGDGIDDTRLDWTPPATNIYGEPTVLDHQEIYAGSTPTFPADMAHRLAIVSGGVSSYIHENGFGSGVGYFYLIVAVDTNGYRSGVSRELPRGIDGLTLARSGGNIQFTWPEVTHDLDGRPTIIGHHVLYGGATPFRRSEIVPAMIVRDNVTATTLSIPLPAGSIFYYSMIAVDDKGSQTPW